MKVGFIVTFDDHSGSCFPMTWDRSCKGAICCASEKEPLVIFPDKAAARKAITISARFAVLEKEQGVPCNEEFLGKREHIRIVPCIAAPAPQTDRGEG